MSAADDILTSAPARAAAFAAGEMSARPSRRVAVLTCMDTRIEAPAMLGLRRGEAHVLRNAGGLVTEDAIRSLVVSQEALGTEEVLVVMHDHCGMRGAPERLGGFEDTEETLRQGLAKLRSSPELAFRDRIRGFVFDPKTGSLRDVEG